MQIVYGILGLLIFGLLALVCTSISSCARYCSDAISDLKSDNLGTVVANVKTSPLSAEFGISAVSISALKEKEDALKEAIEVLHKQYVEQYSKEAKGRFERELARRKAAKEEKEVLERTLRKISKESDAVKDAQFKLRDFALRESPVLWETLQSIRAEIEVKDREMVKIMQIAHERSTNIETDEAYLKIQWSRNGLVRDLRIVEDQITNAYLSKCKAESTPTDKEILASKKKITDDGMIEADMVGKRYEEIKNLRSAE